MDTPDAGSVHPSWTEPEAPPFVGRWRELTLLSNKLKAAFDGHGSAVLIAGEPGIGKTHLAEQLTELAIETGGEIHWGRCYDGTGAPAFWPWIQVLRSIVNQTDRAGLIEHIGLAGSDLAQILPELRQLIPDLPESTLQGDVARFRLFDGVTTFLRSLSADAPVLIVLDDLQWADRSSLLLLEYLAREVIEARLLVVGLHRDTQLTPDSPLLSTIAEVGREPSNRQMKLTGLKKEEVGQLLTAMGARPVAPEAARRVTERTGGNPFFVREVARSLEYTDENVRERSVISDEPGVPIGVSALIQQSLRQLSDHCRKCLRSAAVIGREFDLRVLAKVEGQSVDAVMDVLDSAIQAQLIRDQPDAPLHYRFVHDLIRETLYDDMSPSQRAGIHERVGLSVEKLFEAELGQHYAALAYHFFTIAPVRWNGKAISYSIAAGNRAISHIAYDDAIEHYRRALLLINQMENPDPVLRCNALVALGFAQRAVGPSFGYDNEPQTTFRHAANVAREIDSPVDFARAVLGFAGPNPFNCWGEHEQIQLLEEALGWLPENHPRLRARLLSRLAVDLQIVPGSAERSKQLSNEAVNVARALEDSSVLTFALLAQHVIHGSPDNIDFRMNISSDLLRIAALPNDLHALYIGMMLRVQDLLETGDYAGARAVFDWFMSAVTPFRFPDILIRSPQASMNIVWALIRGDLFEANERLKEQIEFLVHPTGYFRGLFVVLREQGRHDELRSLLNKHILIDSAKLPLVREYRIYRLLLDAEQGDQAAAREELAGFAVNGFRNIPMDRRWLPSGALLAESCAILEEDESAAQLYEHLHPFSERFVAQVSGSGYLGPVAHYLGLLAATIGRWEAAERHFRHALAVNERMGARAFTARTRFAWAAMLLRRGDSSDVEQARELLAEVRQVTSELGMVTLGQQAEQLWHRHFAESFRVSEQLAMSDRETANAYPAGLTRREVEILALVAQGLSNPQVADRLYLSPRTVGQHLRSIYGKLGVGSRAAATRFAVENDLI